MRRDRTSQLTIFLAKRCGCMKEPSGFGRQAMMKRFCDGIHVLVPSPEHDLSRVRSTIFDRYLNRNAARQAARSALYSSAKASIIFLLKAGMSSGFRLVT